MAERIINGLGPLEFGESSGTTEMPVVMTPAFRTYRDSVTFDEAEDSITEEFADQDDAAIISLSTPGEKSVKGSTFDYSNETLTMLKGGTVLNGQWVEPAVKPVIIKAFRLTTKDGTPFEWPKVQVFARFNANYKHNGVSLLEFTIKPLSQVRIGKKL